MISNAKHQEILAAEREHWLGVVERLLDRIATFQPTREDGGAALALTATQPSVPKVPGADVAIDPEPPYISDFEMDDPRWEQYVEAARASNHTLDEHNQPQPRPVV